MKAKLLKDMINPAGPAGPKQTIAKRGTVCEVIDKPGFAWPLYLRLPCGREVGVKLDEVELLRKPKRNANAKDA